MRGLVWFVSIRTFKIATFYIFYKYKIRYIKTQNSISAYVKSVSVTIRKKPKYYMLEKSKCEWICLVGLSRFSSLKCIVKITFPMLLGYNVYMFPFKKNNVYVFMFK